jgi:hypothetical protein
VTKINDFILDCSPRDKCLYLSNDIVYKSSRDSENANLLFLIAFINQLEFNGVPLHTLS